ncbi:MAG TPA: O-antigen ligase family protein [Candidatus Baltobacteraceae bacterium]|nr:O-antigen ligase family protein [Candidatus Baltobacteraceae bacterium]
MNRFYYALIILVGSAIFFIVPARAYADQAIYPSGLAGGSDIISGLYPGTDAGNCCWMGPDAVIKVAVTPGADTLLLNVYMPDFAVKRGPQSLRVQVNGGRPVLHCCLGSGEHEVTVPLPRAARHGVALVHLRAGTTFVPRDLGLNDDPRHLSIMIREVGFLNAATGERLDTAPLPWMPARAAIPILLLCAAMVLALTLRRPIYGVVALIFTDPFLFAYTVHGTTITLPKVSLVAVALGIALRAPRLLRGRSFGTFWLLAGAQLLFAVTMLLGSLHASSHGAALRETFKALEYLMTILVAYFAYRLDPDERAVRIALTFITIAVTALAFAQLFAGALESEVIAGHNVARIAGPIEGPNQLAGFLGVVVPAMLAFAVLRPPFLLERVAIALGTVACVLTFSRGGIGALLLGAAALLAVRYQPARRGSLGAGMSALFALVLALAFGVFSGALHGRVQSLFGSTGDGSFNGGLGSRLDLWHGAYALWRSHPIFGIGPGNFELEIGHYDPGVRTHANGMFFQVLAEQGIAGLIAMFAVVAASIGAFVRRLNEPLALGACIAGVAMAFHQIVDCMWIYPKVGVIWFVLLALGAAAVDLAARTERVAEPPVA